MGVSVDLPHLRYARVAVVLPKSGVVRLTSRIALAVAALTAVIVLVAFGGFLVFQAGRPRVSQAAATALALLQVQQMDPNVRGFVAVSARYDAAPDRVYDDRGNVIFSESHSSCQIWLFQGPGWLCHADGAWIVHLHAPPQGGFNNHDAYIQVNGQNGTVSSASTNSS